MTKYDGSLQLGNETTPLMKTLLARRSVRKYQAAPATPAQVRYIEECVRAFCTRMTFESPRMVVVGRGEGYEQVVAAATSGLLGKINPWLMVTKASHLILCGTVYPSDVDRSKTERAIAEASMAMQVAVLAATEVGLGTCWMAGIHHERVERAYPMPDGAALIAISSLGTGPSRLGLSWDAMAYHLVSKRRKPIGELWMRDGWKEIA